MNSRAQIDSSADNSAHRIPAVEKTIRILRLLAEEGPGLPSKYIAVRVGASPSTCYRILKTLEAAGWVATDGNNGYEVGSGLLPVTEPLADLRRIVRAARPLLEDLARELGITTKLCARQGADQVTVAVGSPEVSIGILTPIGIPYPVVEAASGAALLAHLEPATLETLITKTPPAHWRRHSPEALRERVAQCRARGWCENIGTHPQGIDAIACPVDHPIERFSLCFIGFRGDFGKTALPKLRDKLLAARERLNSLQDQI